eukprot:62914-Prorocentrum_minimum.AAC.3
MPEQSPTMGKPVVAVDCDEVLAKFVPALIRWHNAKYGTDITMEGFHSYRYCEVWGGNDQEAVTKVYDFFETDYFKEQMELIEGAFEVLQSFQDR